MTKQIVVRIVAAGAAIAALGTTACTRATAANTSLSNVERGKYLVTIGGCNDCHTPWKMGAKGPEPDMSRMLSGHPSNMVMPAPKSAGTELWAWNGAITNTAFAGPWGISYARNLTPDQVSGLGIWDEAMFIKTIRTGRHMGVSRPLLPPMPWPNYAQMSDQDLKAVYAFLRSIPPVRNEVPDAVIAGGM